MATKYFSSTETTNFARLSRLVVDVCSDVLRDVLRVNIPPPGLTAILQSQRVHLSRNLEPRQQQILFPPGGVFTGTLEDLDFSLLYKLIRNLQGINISPHTKGWGRTPDNTDRSLAANIDRLRIQRNETHGHLSRASLSSTDFHRIWGIIRQCISEIEQGSLTGDTYVTAVDNLLTVGMDPDTENEDIEKLSKQQHDFEAIMEDVRAEQETMATCVNVVTTRQETMDARQETMAKDINDVTIRQETMNAMQETMATDISDVTTRLETMDARQESMATDINDVTTRLEIMDARQETMATDINDVPTRLETMDARQETMTTDISDVTTRLETMDARQETMATDIADVTIRLETMDVRQETMATDIGDVTARQETLEARQETVAARQEAMANNLHTIQDEVIYVRDALNTTATNTSHITEIHSDLKPMIDKTKARITQEKEKKKFLATKAFHDAQGKLQKNRVLVIKGNTGDGKTSTAIQLLHWLIEQQPCRQPLQLHKIKKLDLLAPNSHLITFIDDIFGEKDVGRMDVQEWNQRITDLQTLFVDEQIRANFLIITIRNEILNNLAKSSLGSVFIEHNIIDLSSDEYKIAEEKRQLLEMYNPENVSWKEEEKEEILDYAPDIGFPQCCQLFCKSVELQERRADFFKKPFQFFMEALSKLPECSAILFLFLNDGEIKVTDLDPNGNKVNKTLLEEAFEISLVDGEVDRTSMTFKKKVGSVKDSLDRLAGFLVRKETYRSNDEVYRFDHDSIYVTVALLYGNKTPFGYITNCPSRFLSYLTTSKTSSNMIVISSDHFTYLCERVLKEFKYIKDPAKFQKDAMECLFGTIFHGTGIGSLDVWKDHVFVERFVQLLEDRKVDKRAVLDEACYFGAKECAKYLLREGVQPYDVISLWSLITKGKWLKGDLNVLEEVLIYLNNELKHGLLKTACYSRSLEDVSYLLSKGVKSDGIDWWSLIRRNPLIDIYNSNELLDYLGLFEQIDIDDSDRPMELSTEELSLIKENGEYISKGDVDVLKKVVKYLNDEIKLDLLNKACRSGSEDCALCLLCDGVKPDEQTLIAVVRGGSIDVMRKLLKYDITSTGKLSSNNDILHMACMNKREEMVTILCDAYPHLVHDTDENGQTPLQIVAGTGNCSMFQTVERTVLNSLCRVEDEQHKCETVDGCVVHRSCICSQYMSRLVDVYGLTVLHATCIQGQCKEICVYLCESYPALVTVVDQNGRTALDVSCLIGNKEICVYLCESYPTLTTAVDKNGRTALHGTKRFVYICVSPTQH
ncbi:uncharacterized protein LOC117318531 [Pecten maximus]|uniref:uncharacterized protein LOC117318531 n=1 Tax=Pecten maximus TaxID=6579 RepID=UPI0014583B57|nr:uncharacterized protein LOC117318531 [Pecten maximus]